MNREGTKQHPSRGAAGADARFRFSCLHRDSRQPSMRQGSSLESIGTLLLAPLAKCPSEIDESIAAVTRNDATWPPKHLLTRGR
jgi:hypothetical protein